MSLTSSMSEDSLTRKPNHPGVPRPRLVCGAGDASRNADGANYGSQLLGSCCHRETACVPLLLSSVRMCGMAAGRSGHALGLVLSPAWSLSAAAMPLNRTGYGELAARATTRPLRSGASGVAFILVLSWRSSS